MQATGGNEYASAGAMGNIDWESGGIDASKVELKTGRGIGICQWTDSRRTKVSRVDRRTRSR